MSYVKSNLIKDEEILYMAKIHWYIFVPSIFMMFIGIALFFSSTTMGLFNIPNITNNEFKELIEKGFMFLSLAIMFFSFISFLKAFIFKFSTELAVTNKRVIAKIGFIQRETLELNHSKVESFTVDQSILGRILDYGDIFVRGTGGVGTPVKNIDNPIRFRKEAMSAYDLAEEEN